MLTENQILLLLQIPLAGVVVLVVILFLKHLKEAAAAFMIAQEKQMTAFLTVQDKQLVMFMSAIKEQREQNTIALREVVTSVKELDQTIIEKLTEMEVDRARRKVT